MWYLGIHLFAFKFNTRYINFVTSSSDGYKSKIYRNIVALTNEDSKYIGVIIANENKGFNDERSNREKLKYTLDRPLFDCKYKINQLAFNLESYVTYLIDSYLRGKLHVFNADEAMVLIQKLTSFFLKEYISVHRKHSKTIHSKINGETYESLVGFEFMGYLESIISRIIFKYMFYSYLSNYVHLYYYEGKLKLKKLSSNNKIRFLCDTLMAMESDMESKQYLDSIKNFSKNNVFGDEAEIVDSVERILKLKRHRMFCIK